MEGGEENHLPPPRLGEWTVLRTPRRGRTKVQGPIRMGATKTILSPCSGSMLEALQRRQ